MKRDAANDAAWPDAGEFERRLAYLGFDARDGELLNRLLEGARQDRDAFMTRFHAFLGGFPETAGILARSADRARVRAVHAEQVEAWLGGPYDLAYARSRARIGETHHRIGLAPQWHIGAYARYLEWLLPFAEAAAAGDGARYRATVLALFKVALLDIGLALDAYFRADRERLHLLAKVFESDLEAVLICDADGVVLEANHMAPVFSGHAVADLVGRPLACLVAPRDKETFAAGWQQAGAAGVWHGDIWHRRADGSDYLARMSVATVEGATGGRHCIVEYSDATETWAAERALKERSEELARSNRDLEQFAYVASHDLQEPLRMVASYTRLLARRYHDKLDDNAREFIDFAVDGATRMQGLINDLLKYSRVGTQAKPFAPAAADRLLDDALANLRVALEESGATVEREPMPPRLHCDATQIVQLLQNLIGNAIKFRRPEVPPRIRIGAQRVAGAWRFSVRDNGIGISPEYFERIFAIFQRLHARDEYPGNGIGLAVCKKIVERHGGKIWVESRIGEGAEFFFTISDAAGERDAGN